MAPTPPRTVLERLLRWARPVSVAVFGLEMTVFISAVGFIVRPSAAPAIVLTSALLVGAALIFPLAALAVVAALQRNSVAHTTEYEEAEIHLGWRGPAALALFVFAVAMFWFHPPVDARYGASDPFAGRPDSVRVRGVLDQLRLVSSLLLTSAGWIALSLTREHPEYRPDTNDQVVDSSPKVDATV